MYFLQFSEEIKMVKLKTRRIFAHEAPSHVQSFGTITMADCKAKLQEQKYQPPQRAPTKKAPRTV